MAHYAQVINSIVEQVIVIERDVLDSGTFGDPSQWIQTSYNTHGGEHLLGGTPLRKNFAGIGFTYDPARDAFYAPQPYPSWLIDEETCFWHAPIPKPPMEEGMLDWQWNEYDQRWDPVYSNEWFLNISSTATSITTG
jgi:hypothetical protein